MSGRILRPESHDDLLGDFATGITGAHKWLEANIGDTEFPIAWLRDNSDDYYCVKAQSLHTRKHNVNLDSIHVHYILQTASTAGQTIVYDLYYTWLTVGVPCPSIANWNKALGVVQTLGTHAANYYSIFSIVNNIAPPSPEAVPYTHPRAHETDSSIVCRLLLAKKNL